MRKTLNILIADDHWIARCALVQVVRCLDEDVDVFEAQNFDDAKNILLTEPCIDMVLLDLVMPGMAPMAGLKALKEAAPNVPIVVISVNEDRETVLTALEVGISGFVPKTSGREQILKSLRLVLAGEVALPQRIIANQQFTNPLDIPPELSHPTPLQKSHDKKLTPRQSEIYDLLSEGLSNNDIAERLGLSPNTVRVHVHGIMQRLDLSNRTQAALKAAAQN